MSHIFLRTGIRAAGIFLCLIIISAPLMAQDSPKKGEEYQGYYLKPKKNVIRTFWSKFNFSFSTGYGRTFYSHKLDGYGIFQPQQEAGLPPRVFPLGTNTTFTNWFNRFETDSLGISGNGLSVASDTTEGLGFRGAGLSIPFKASIHYEWDKYRFGLGIIKEFHFIGNMRARPKTLRGSINDFDPPTGVSSFTRYFAMMGVTFYRFEEYTASADVQLGFWKLGSDFNNNDIQKSIYLNIGVSGEKDLSEYLRVFVRPSIEFKGYRLLAAGDAPEIRHRLPALFVNVGFRYRFPELPRCPVDGCRTQINHVHVYKKKGAVEFRSRVHPIYKWQNPHYGQNNPRLIKYKKKNKKKLNPY
ncbi:MAG: hypothetical protein AAFX87_22330 [Bacteroidota bacterium]